MATTAKGAIQACGELAAKQQGLVTLDQARRRGATKDVVYRLVSDGMWSRVLPGVYRLFGPSSWRQKAVAVGLWVGDGGAISNRTAGRWWGFDAVKESAIEARVLGRRKKPEGLEMVLHLTDRFSPVDRGRRGDLWITSPGRTLVDLASVLPFESLEAAVHSALRKRQTTVSRLTDFHERQSGRGRSGVTSMRKVLADIDSFGAPTGSHLETRFMQLIRKARFPTMHRQVEVWDAGRFVARVDFAYPDRRFAIEVQSYEFHSERRDWKRDQEKVNDLRRAGWDARLATKEDIEHPQRILGDIAKVLGHQVLFDA